jgi:hypothetical protein
MPAVALSAREADAGGSVIWVRTTNPSSGSPSQVPVLRISSVNERTCEMDSSVMYFVLMKPHSSAKASTVSGGRVQNSFVQVLMPWRYNPVFPGGYGRTCSSNESSQSYGVKGELESTKHGNDAYLGNCGPVVIP